MNNLTPDEEEEEVELEPQIAVTIPFVSKSPVTTTTSLPTTPKPLTKSCSSPVSSHHLKTPLDARRSAPINGSSRPASPMVSDHIELDRLSSKFAMEMHDNGSRRPSALDILSHQGSEGAQAAVERAKERRRIVIVMHRITQILLYVLPTIIVLCLILYWTIETGETKWLTMMAAVLGVACVIDFILFQYFTNRVEGTDLLNTVARFRARLNKSGRRF